MSSSNPHTNLKLKAPHAVRFFRFYLIVYLSFLVFSQQAHADYAAVATGKPYLAILDLTKNTLATTITTGGITRSVALDQTGKVAYTAAGTRLIAIQVSTRKTLASLNFYEQVQSVKVDSTGNNVIVLTSGKISRIWLLTSNPLKATNHINLKEKVRNTLAINPNGSQAAVIAKPKNQLKLINLKTQRKNPQVQAVVLPNTKRQQSNIRGKVLTNVRGVAFENRSILWASTKNKKTALIAINTLKRKPSFSVSLPTTAGESITIDAQKNVALLSPSSQQKTPLVVNLKNRSTLRLAAGLGTSINDFSFDGYHYYLLNPRRKKILIVSRLKNVQTETISLPQEWRPTDIAIQHTPLNQTGTPQDDTLLGSRYPNAINGLDGNDTIDGFIGADTLNGGPGNDIIHGGTEPDILRGEDGNDQLYEEDRDGKIFGGSGDDIIDGGTGNDAIDGDDGNDAIDGGEHDDTIYGGVGDDQIIEKVLGNEPLIDGGPGNDYIDSGLGSDQKLLGSEGNDTLFGRSGNEMIDGGSGDDTIDGGTGLDILYGQDGADLIRGSQNADMIYGSAGNDTLDGGSGSDTLLGDVGDDVIVGGTGPDIIDAGPGDDVVRVADQNTPLDPKITRTTLDLDKPMPIESSRDIVNCGPGIDTVYTENTPESQDQLTDCEQIVLINPEPSSDEPIQQATVIGVNGPDYISGTPEGEILLGADGNDQVLGNEGDDYVDGENDDDEVYGGPGNDIAQGRYGNDKVNGDDGNDYVVGGYDKDDLFGGAGDDILSLGYGQDSASGGPGNDQIMAADREKDTITCGPGFDIVFADPIDQIDLASCETIRY